VETDVNALFLVLGIVSLGIGGLGIANVTLLSVLERIGEVGLVAPLIGALVGLIAGTYPAWRASAIEPIAALRSSSL
jgi:putative ABC transport system permease protein